MSDVHALQFLIDPQGSSEILRDTWASDVSQVTRKRRMTNVLNAGRGGGAPLVPGMRPNLQALAPGNANGRVSSRERKSAVRGMRRMNSHHL